MAKYLTNNTCKLFLTVVFLGHLAGCGSATPPTNHAPGPDGSPGEATEFNYKTTQKVKIQFQLKYKNVEFDIFDNSDKKIAHINVADNLNYSTIVTVPNTTSYLRFTTTHLGLISNASLQIVNKQILYIQDDLPEDDFTVEDTLLQQMKSVSQPAYNRLGSWDRNGTPKYLSETIQITDDLIAKLNEVLPEKEPVPDYRPQYLSETLDTALHIVKSGNVFVTFVHEGAGYRNSLGFYTYETIAGPPQEIGESDVTLIFPNVSYKGGGGGLRTGDTVNIGYFEEGTSIGWVLSSNAYSRRFQEVLYGYHTFYSNNEYNPDPSPHQQHFVQIDLGDFIALGVEDLLRPRGDNDFNDAVFTVSADPVDAINRDGLIRDTSINKTEPDNHEEEVILAEDPNFEISGYQFFPGENKYGTLAFEDLWPHKGDYDFNDLVIDYNVIEALDKNNKIVQIELKLKIVGILASMKNGFGLQLGVPPTDIASVSGTKNTVGYIKREPNGTEQRQEKAVIIPFEDATAHYNASSPDDSELIVITIKFTRGLERNELGFAPYNPFIMSNGERGREVHLPGYQPTSLVHLPYFGSWDDDSVIGTSYVYKTLSDLPWAIHLPESFSYPHDSIRINEAYLLFDSWVESDGFSHADWYTNKAGYRDDKKILRK